MGRAATAVAGAAGGAVVGLLLLVLTHPTAAYTNDAYRSGASTGFVVRYVALGVVAAFLIRALARRRQPLLAGIALAVVAAVAILPPALDEQTPSEKRRAAAVSIDDAEERERAEFRAGAIDGCVKSTRRDLEASPELPDVDPEKYCTCVMDGLFAQGGFDAAEMEETTARMREGRPTARMRRVFARCVRQA